MAAALQVFLPLSAPPPNSTPQLPTAAAAVSDGTNFSLAVPPSPHPPARDASAVARQLSLWEPLSWALSLMEALPAALLSAPALADLLLAALEANVLLRCDGPAPPPPPPACRTAPDCPR